MRPCPSSVTMLKLLIIVDYCCLLLHPRVNCSFQKLVKVLLRFVGRREIEADEEEWRALAGDEGTLKKSHSADDISEEQGIGLDVRFGLICHGTTQHKI